ncbi:conserved membrane hypothetical protein [Tenacibaculum sp. 190524A05c]|uniref:hypothetical protein n=1 Tax=Tenacibaculum platacis TaxID=3137852 RepID=UPI0031FBA2B7
MTQSQKKKQETNKILAFFKAVFVLVLVVLSLISVFFDEYSPEYLSHKKTYKSIIKKRDRDNRELITSYSDKLKKQFPNDKNIQEIAEQLVIDYDNNYKQSKASIKAYNAKKKELVYAHSFRGRSSFHFWLALFGLVTLGFYFAVKSLFDSFSRGSTFKHQLVDIAGIIVCTFWAVHLIFLTQRDFLTNKYVGTLLLSSVLISGFIYFTVKYFNYKDLAIKNLADLLVRTKEEHYERVAVKAYYAEKNDKPIISLDTTKQNIEDFDKDVEETIKDL